MSLVKHYVYQLDLSLVLQCLFFLTAKIERNLLLSSSKTHRPNFSYGLSFFSVGLVKLFDSSTELYKNNLQPTVLQKWLYSLLARKATDYS